MSTIAKGLDGVVVDNTNVSHVMPESSSLTYRGYPAHELADKCRFEEVAYLILRDDLPSLSQLAEFNETERSLRNVEPAILEVVRSCPKSAHPMDVVRTAVSLLGAYRRDTLEMDLPAARHAAMQMLAQLPTIVAACFRARHDQPTIAPDWSLGYSENFFHMCFGKVPDATMIKTFDVSMTMYAEHSFNASTFTGRVISSTLSDIYSAVTGAIAALKGPLHGGANEAVMVMLQEIDQPSRAQAWVLDALAGKKKIMGFGHRVYKKQDSRAPTMQHYGLALARHMNQTKWHEISAIVEQVMIEKKNIYPNLDFPSAPAYFLMGFDIDLFTPLFVMARITGWCAHIFEQMQSNRLIRPLSEYTGAPERRVVDIHDR